MYNRKNTQLVNRQHEINTLLEQHHNGNEQFKIALTSLITLASSAYDIFESSTIDEKRQLIGYVFSNLELEGAKLRYTLKKPFDLFVDLASYQEWLPGPDPDQLTADFSTTEMPKNNAVLYACNLKTVKHENVV